MNGLDRHMDRCVATSASAQTPSSRAIALPRECQHAAHDPWLFARRPSLCSNVVARLRGKLDVPPEVLDSTLEGPRFQDSRETQGAPITSEAGLMTALIRRLRDLEADAKAKAATFQQVHIDKKKLEDK